MKLLIDSLGSRPLNAALITFLVTVIIVVTITIVILRLTNSCEAVIMNLLDNPWYSSLSFYARGNHDGAYYQSALFAFHTALLSMLFSYHPAGQAAVASMPWCTWCLPIDINRTLSLNEQSINLTIDLYDKMQPYMTSNEDVENFVTYNATPYANTLQQKYINEISVGCQSVIWPNIQAAYFAYMLESIFIAFDEMNSFNEYLKVCANEVCGCEAAKSFQEFNLTKGFLSVFHGYRELQLCFHRMAMASISPCESIRSLSPSRPSRILSKSSTYQNNKSPKNMNDIKQTILGNALKLSGFNIPDEISRYDRNLISVLPKGTFTRSHNVSSNNFLFYAIDSLLAEIDSNSTEAKFDRVCGHCSSYLSITDMLTEDDLEMYIYCVSLYVLAISSETNEPCNKTADKLELFEDLKKGVVSNSFLPIRYFPDYLPFSQVAKGYLGYDADIMFDSINYTQACFQEINETYRLDLGDFCSSLSTNPNSTHLCTGTMRLQEGSNMAVLVVCCFSCVLLIAHFVHLLLMKDIAVRSTLKLLCLIDIAVICLCNPWLLATGYLNKEVDNSAVATWLFSKTTDPMKYLASEVFYSMGWASLYVGYNFFILNIQIQSYQNLRSAEHAQKAHQKQNKNTISEGIKIPIDPKEAIDAAARNRYRDKWETYIGWYQAHALFASFYMLARIFVLYFSFGITVGMIPFVYVITLGRFCGFPFTYDAPYCHGVDLPENQLPFWGIIIAVFLDFLAVLTTAYRVRKASNVLNKVPFIVARFDHLVLRIIRMMTSVLFAALLLLGVIYCATGNLILLYDGFLDLQSEYMYSNLSVRSTGVTLWRFGFCIILLVYEISLSILFFPIDSMLAKQCIGKVNVRDKRVEFSIKEPTIDIETSKPWRFISDPNVFTFDTQFLALQFSHMVYLTGVDKVSHNLLKGTKYQAIDHVYDQITDTHVWIIESDDRIIVSFRGTVSAANAKTDLTLNLVPLKWKPLESKLIKITDLNSEGPIEKDIEGLIENKENTIDNWWEEQIKQIQENQQNLKISQFVKSRTRVHSGFLIAWSTVQDRVVEHLLRLRIKDKENGLEVERSVHVTGHSLGGALATVCSLYLTSCLHFDVICSTFGSPRVGNYQFRDYYEAYVPATWRVITKHDPIPRTPSISPIPGIGYVHVGRTVLLLFEGDMLVDPSIVEENLITYCSRVKLSSHLLFEYITAMLRFTLSPRFQLSGAGLNNPNSVREGIDDKNWEPYVPKMFTTVQDALFKNMGKLHRANTVRNHFGDDKGKHQTLNDTELSEREKEILKQQIANIDDSITIIQEDGQDEIEDQLTNKERNIKNDDDDDEFKSISSKDIVAI